MIIIIIVKERILIVPNFRIVSVKDAFISLRRIEMKDLRVFCPSLVANRDASSCDDSIIDLRKEHYRRMARGIWVFAMSFQDTACGDVLKSHQIASFLP